MVTHGFMRRLSSSLLLATLALLLLPLRLAADLVWTPEGGWKVQGGVLAPSAGSGAAAMNGLDTMNKARAAEEAGHEGEAIKLYSTVTKKYPNSIYASEAMFRTGLIQQKQRKYYKAFMTFQMMTARYPNSEKFNQVIGEQYRVASDLFEGKRAKIFSWLPGFKNRERSIQYFETIVMTAPYSDYAPLALMNAAKGYKLINETEAAIDALDRMINTYPRNVLTSDAYLKIAEAHASLVDGPLYDQASTKEAITYYEDYMILFPGDAGMAAAEKGLDKMRTTLSRSKLELADYYYKYRKNFKAAKVLYNEAITVYPDSKVAAEARQKLDVLDAQLGLLPQGSPAAPKPAPKKKKFWLF